MGLFEKKRGKDEPIQGESHHASIHWLRHIGEQWEIFRQNTMGIIGLVLLVILAQKS